jgi:hypothetical protein
MFSARERVAQRLAELMVVDHLKIDDAFFPELRGHFTEAAVLGIDLVWASRGWPAIGPTCS